MKISELPAEGQYLIYRFEDPEAADSVDNYRHYFARSVMVIDSYQYHIGDQVLTIGSTKDGDFAWAYLEEADIGLTKSAERALSEEDVLRILDMRSFW